MGTNSGWYDPRVTRVSTGNPVHDNFPCPKMQSGQWTDPNLKKCACPKLRVTWLKKNPGQEKSCEGACARPLAAVIKEAA